MKEFTISKNNTGQRLDRWLAEALPLLRLKYIRLKRVKLNGKGLAECGGRSPNSTTSSLTSPRRKTPFSLCPAQAEYPL